MGAWGPGLYSCDVALDLKADIAALVRLPLDAEDLVAKVRAQWPCADDPADEDYSDFWLVLADRLHVYGIADRATRDRVRQIVDSGADLEMKRSLGMAPGELRKRAAVLTKLAGKLGTANAKPRDRRVLHKAEPFALDLGACVAYPGQDGNAPNLFLPQSDIDRTFQPNSWGAFIVLGRGHKFGVFARHLIARLAVDRSAKPTRASCAASHLSANKSAWSREPPTPAVAWVEVTKPHLGKLAAEPLGTLTIDGEAVRQSFDAAPKDEGRDWHTLCGLLQPFDPGGRLLGTRAVRMRKLPLARFLAEGTDS